MGQLKKIARELSFVFGRKPIVYFVTEDIDFIDMLFEYNPSFCPMDFVGGEYRPIDKAAYVKKFYNSSQGDFWKSLVDENGAILQPPKFNDAGNPTYCYIKNFDYILGLNHKAKEAELYSCLMKYVSGYHLLNEAQKAQNILVLSGATFDIPSGIAPFVEVIDVPYPDEQDFLSLFETYGVLKKNALGPVATFWQTQAVNMKGFTNLRVGDILKMLRIRYPAIASMNEQVFQRNQDEIKKYLEELINEQKIQTVKKNGILQFIDYPPVVTAAGCQNVEDFIQKRKTVFLSPQRFPGVTPPKGILFAGVPGTGKSLMAKKIASILDVPLLKLDMGSLMDKHIGESESRLRRALKMAESVAPCVLFIDELEKAFSTGDNSHEVSKRMFGYMLGWMQDCKEPVFIYATANHLNMIDGAFLRSGRFDSKFFAFMPNGDQCTDIFIGCIKKRKEAFEKANTSLFSGHGHIEKYRQQIEAALEVAAKEGKFLNGADIECWINLTISGLYYRGLYPPYDADTFFSVMLDELKNLSAYGKSNMKEIAQYWLQNRFGSIEPSDTPLFPFSDFDLDRKNPPKDGTADENSSYFQKRGAQEFGSTYDYLLYRAIVDAIDKISYTEIRHKYMNLG